MVSPTHQTRLRRHRKKIKQGQSRKVNNRNKGTTVPHAKLFGDDESTNPLKTHSSS